MTPLPPAADHARHDPLIVAEAADRDGRLPPELAACPDCRALHADLVALAAAVPTAARPRRPRDYTLTPTDAARLRPAGWRGWFARIGTARDTVTRPLALGLTTLGLAGLLLAAAPSLLPMGGATSGPAAAGEGGGRASSEITLQGAAPTATAAARAAAAPSAAAAPPTRMQSEQAAPEIASPAVAADGNEPAMRDTDEPATDGAILLVASAACLMVGVGLFLVRRIAGRRTGMT